MIIGIAYYDFIYIPKKSKDYLKSCYYVGFRSVNSGTSNKWKADIYYECLGAKPDQNIVYQCWKDTSPETLNYINSTLSCPKDLYDSEKLLFK